MLICRMTGFYVLPYLLPMFILQNIYILKNMLSDNKKILIPYLSINVLGGVAGKCTASPCVWDKL